MSQEPPVEPKIPPTPKISRERFRQERALREALRSGRVRVGRGRVEEGDESAVMLVREGPHARAALRAAGLEVSGDDIVTPPGVKGVTR